MHFVGLALGPAEKTAHTVPAVFIVIIVHAVAALLAVDDEVLIGLRQFLERHVDIDLLTRAGAQQILLRFAKFDAAKNAYRAFLDTEAAVRNRFI